MTLSDVQLHAYIIFHLGYYVFKSFIVTCILHCDCFKSSINTNKVVIEFFYSTMLKLQCLSTWILVVCESHAHRAGEHGDFDSVQLNLCRSTQSGQSSVMLKYFFDFYVE